MKYILVLLGLLVMTNAAHAQTEPFNTPTSIKRDGVTLTLAQEREAEEIGNKLRCLVCQNETVENSQAGLAKQFRGIIRRHLARGENARQIVDFMVQRYGIFILMKPPLMRVTWLLWASPALASLAGLFAVVLIRRRRQKPPPPLSPQEASRLQELLKP
ncbi:MAG: cytochrome C biogenesis protein [Rhodospirillales bacterium 20-60-12]|nr:MAG: cytochrome C biogenesis protein [Rhodospirillales bacterium 20-60-12]HQT66312.1 cytochrome c-type biogenesis protein CcmH [Acetobacteraceae bacterium]